MGLASIPSARCPSIAAIRVRWELRGAPCTRQGRCTFRWGSSSFVSWSRAARFPPNTCGRRKFPPTALPGISLKRPPAQFCDRSWIIDLQGGMFLTREIGHQRPRDWCTRGVTSFYNRFRKLIAVKALPVSLYSLFRGRQEHWGTVRLYTCCELNIVAVVDYH